MDALNKKLKKIINYIVKNKYWLTIVFFAVWFMFFDQNNFISIIRYNNKISDLTKQKAELIETIKRDSIKLHQLKTDDKSLEKFAREEYFMHKPNEEVFVIRDKK